MSAAEHDRAAILNRVAEGIWNAEPEGFSLTWSRAVVVSQHPSQMALAHAVAKTRAEARAAVRALMIGVRPRQEDVRLAMAGEHATGVVGGLCIEAFDAMLAEVLE